MGLTHRFKDEEGYTALMYAKSRRCNNKLVDLFENTNCKSFTIIDLEERIKDYEFFKSLNWNLVSRCQNMTEEFIDKYRDYIKFNLLQHNKWMKIRAVYEAYFENGYDKTKYILSMDNMNDIFMFL